MMNVPGKGGEEDEENLLPLSPTYDLQQIKGTEIKVSHRFTLGDVNSQTMCVRFDPHDKYIAQGCHDGKIRIWNVFTGNESFCLNEHMDQPMPTMMVRWRPEKSKAITKNVILSVNANGALQHWHTTSGKLLHTIFDELNQLLACDYNYDGTQFVAGGSDSVVRVYDEQTRGLVCELQGGGSGAPGHSSKVFCVKFD
jgi:WD40 repeat protein